MKVFLIGDILSACCLLCFLRNGLTVPLRLTWSLLRSPSWPQAQNLTLPTSKCWDYQHALPHLAHWWLLKNMTSSPPTFHYSSGNAALAGLCILLAYNVGRQIVIIKEGISNLSLREDNDPHLGVLASSLSLWFSPPGGKCWRNKGLGNGVEIVSHPGLL